MNLTPIQELESALREHPANAELYLRLAPLYLEKGRDHEAEKLLAKGTEATADARIIRQWEELILARHERNVAFAQQWLESHDSPEAREALAIARAAQKRDHQEICTARCSREPGNALAHYELGRSLQTDGKLAEAIGELERAMAEGELLSPAALAKAACLRELNQIPGALKHYRMAAAASKPDQMEVKKESLWYAVELCTELKLPNLAARYRTELFRVDPNYGHMVVGKGSAKPILDRAPP